MKVLAKYFFLSLILSSALVESKLGSPATVLKNETATTDMQKAVVVTKRRLTNLVGHGGSPAGKFMPLGECEGDCDSDAQCESGLKCFKRDAFDPVPGCYGGHTFSVGTDFCVKSGGGGPQPSPTPPVHQPTGGGGGLGLCRGDCDDDRDCQSGLVCYQRKKWDAAPPQCRFVATNNQKDYCVKPGGGGAPSPTHPSPTNPRPTAPSPTPPHYTGNGYGLCGGDCDRDSDCKNGLICYQRDRGDPIPAGCSGSVNSRKDFCVDPNNLDHKPDGDTRPYTRKFRLKLYWEEGYEWQDETFERKWCVMRDYDGRPGTGKCWYGLDVLPCNNEHVYTATCNSDDRQQWQFEYVNDSEAIIKVPGENRCLMRSGVNVVLRPCNSGNRLQRFFAIRGGLEERRFELSQRTATRYCLNQAHHPKPGEVIAMYPCSRTRSPEHMTSWWERYEL